MREYLVNINAFCCFAFYIVLMFVVHNMFDNLSTRESEWMLQSAYILAFIIFFNVIIYKKIFGCYITLTSMFVLILELFNFVPTFIMLMGFQYSDYGLSIGDIINNYGSSTYHNVVQISTYFVLFFCAGTILSEVVKNKQNIYRMEGDKKRIKEFAKFLLLISLPFDIFLSIYKFVNVVTDGYGLDNTESSIYLLQYVSFLVFPAFFLLWSAAENCKNKKKIFVFLWFIRL